MTSAFKKWADEVSRYPEGNVVNRNTEDWSEEAYGFDALPKYWSEQSNQITSIIYQIFQFFITGFSTTKIFLICTHKTSSCVLRPNCCSNDNGKPNRYNFNSMP
jgi:hypothetical protein